MQSYWDFPAVLGGNVNSFNNAGLETFKGNEIDSLTREICQNSLDAAKNREEPVIVEFKNFVVETKEFPGVTELKDSFKLCQKT